jgi:hypothetical protein
MFKANSVTELSDLYNCERGTSEAIPSPMHECNLSATRLPRFARNDKGSYIDSIELLFPFRQCTAFIHYINNFSIFNQVFILVKGRIHLAIFVSISFLIPCANPGLIFIGTV